MRIYRISKRNGKYRTIYAPDPEEMRAYRDLLPALLEIAKTHCPDEVVHGFMPGRSPITNAAAHVGYDHTVCFDLEDFFDTVTWRHLLGLIPEDLVEKVTYDGAARQGLPTSPLVSNIAASTLDKRLLTFTKPRGIVYTRYADDLTFSTNDQAVLPDLDLQVRLSVDDCRFRLNHKKTRVQHARAGRRIITGVGVDDSGLHPTRKVRRRLRAATHKRHRASAAGLREWCKLKPPAAAGRDLTGRLAELKRLLRILNAGGTSDADREELRRAIDLL